jgi:hypothetical protein
MTTSQSKKQEGLNSLIQFRSMSLAEFSSHIRCGFELETQAARPKDVKTARVVGDQWDRWTLDIPVNTTAYRDFSVEGPEIVTVGPQTINQFYQALTHVTENNVLKVDHECSFHVHLSLDTLDFWNLHEEILESITGFAKEYILTRFASLPKKVHRRFSSNWGKEYFSVYDETCYGFIRRHEDYPTLEFRFPGNINTREDGMAVLTLLIRALQFGIRQTVLGEIKPVLLLNPDDTFWYSKKKSELDIERDVLYNRSLSPAEKEEMFKIYYSA